MTKLYGCAKCDFTSRNVNDFSRIRGDPYHYCRDCIIEIKKDNQRKKNKNEVQNVSLFGDTKPSWGKIIKLNKMPMDVDNHVD